MLFLNFVSSMTLDLSLVAGASASLTPNETNSTSLPVRVPLNRQKSLLSERGAAAAAGTNPAPPSIRLDTSSAGAAVSRPDQQPHLLLSTNDVGLTSPLSRRPVAIGGGGTGAGGGGSNEAFSPLSPHASQQHLLHPSHPYHYPQLLICSNQSHSARASAGTDSFCLVENFQAFRWR